MNRKQRRFELKKKRSKLGRTKLRCIACERTGQKMTKEHFWPQWLIQHTQAKGVKFIGKKKVNPKSVTIPLCADCNHDFGTHLEAPVKETFEDLENGAGISDLQAEKLVRWLWKFEGLAWCVNNFDDHDASYSTHWTLKQRVLDAPAFEIRPLLTLGISLIEKNNPDKDEWPMGLDSMITEKNSIFVSGVFSRVAILITLSEFKQTVPSSFSLYDFGEMPPCRDEKVFFPEENFEFADDAIDETVKASMPLTILHEKWADDRAKDRPIIYSRKRVLLPDDI